MTSQCPSPPLVLPPFSQSANPMDSKQSSCSAITSQASPVLTSSHDDASMQSITRSPASSQTLPLPPNMPPKCPTQTLGHDSETNVPHSAPRRQYDSHHSGRFSPKLSLEPSTMGVSTVHAGNSNGR